MTPKLSICPLCNDGKEKPSIAGKCQYHYWQAMKAKSKDIKKQKQPINKVSNKQVKRNRHYAKSAHGFFKRLAERQGETVALCEIKLPGCTNYATQRHHVQGRIGELMNDEENQLGTCQHCHHQVEMNPVMAIEKGFSISRNKIQ